MKNIIGFVGVSGSGKTTVINSLEEVGDITLPEISKPDVLHYLNMPLLNLEKASRSQLLKYDIGRLELQIQAEEKLGEKFNYTTVFVDKAAPMLLMYLTTLSARSVKEKVVLDFVTQLTRHVHTYYRAIVYLPLCDFVGKDKMLERNFYSKHLLDVQDAALERVLRWFDVKTITVWQTKDRDGLIKKELGLHNAKRTA